MIKLRSLLLFVMCIVAVTALSGCITAYKTATDERDLAVIKDDTSIKAKIMSAYANDETVKLIETFVAVYNGRVYLVGEYEKAAERERAVKIARETPGVKGVEAHLLPKKDVPGCATGESARLALKVKGLLVKDGAISSTNVDVKGIQCGIVLVGYLGSRSEVRKVIAHAESVEGVRSVKSYLTSVGQ
jgi:hyperosmotically inducible protein